MRVRLWLAWDRATRLWPERALMALVWRLPRRVIHWSVVRAAVTVEPDRSPTDVTASEMLGRF